MLTSSKLWQCGIGFKEGLFTPLPSPICEQHPWTAPKLPILNRVNDGSFFFCWSITRIASKSVLLSLLFNIPLSIKVAVKGLHIFLSFSAESDFVPWSFSVAFRGRYRMTEVWWKKIQNFISNSTEYSNFELLLNSKSLSNEYFSTTAALFNLCDVFAVSRFSGYQTLKG